jgi:coenzyme F420-0:L-glutamate ligase/coenzyme F420-1:gamma-L-glutamate ligase
MPGLGDISIHAVTGLPEIGIGFNLGAAIADAAEISTGDVLAISQKVVSKAEDRVIRLSDVVPGAAAEEIAMELNRDSRVIELIMAESVAIVRKDGPRGILITETHHGFVCANAGIDASNLVESESVVLLPLDSDRSARRIRGEIEAETGTRPAVIVSDSFGRAWRHGQSEVAIGCAGIAPLDDWRGLPDRSGNTLEATNIAVVDEIAAAADLVRNKTSGTPVVRLRGLERFVVPEDGSGCMAQLRTPEDDLFR